MDRVVFVVFAVSQVFDEVGMSEGGRWDTEVDSVVMMPVSWDVDVVW